MVKNCQMQFRTGKPVPTAAEEDTRAVLMNQPVRFVMEKDVTTKMSMFQSCIPVRIAGVQEPRPVLFAAVAEN